LFWYTKIFFGRPKKLEIDRTIGIPKRLTKGTWTPLFSQLYRLSHNNQSILLTQGPIHEILAEIAQLLVVVEILMIILTLVKSSRIYTGQYTFPILVSNDHNILGEHN
jgi:hypothetical protein